MQRLAVISAVLLLFYSAAAGETNEIGRYQLFSGPMDTKDDSGVVRPGTALYRIDTLTGQTWRYDRNLIRGTKEPGGIFAESWVMLGEDHVTSSYIATSITQGEEKANSIYNHFGSTNALSQAMDRMYWPPKRRDEFDAIVAEAAIRRYLSTNSPPIVAKPPPATNTKK